jgi:hypothetical protein
MIKIKAFKIIFASFNKASLRQSGRSSGIRGLNCGNKIK